MRVGDIVAVYWVDSTSPIDAAWHLKAQIKNHLPTLISLGQVLEIDREAVTLVASWSEDDDDGQVGGIITIPRRAIKKTLPLEIQ